MYPHTDNDSADNVQLLAPDFDPNIDQDNQLAQTTLTVDQPAEDNITNAKDPKENNNHRHLSKQHPNQPDLCTLQIPTVSSPTQDEPPPVYYIRKTPQPNRKSCTTNHTSEDEQQDPRENCSCSNSNTLSEREQIRHQYTEKFQNLEVQQFHDQLHQDHQLTYHLPPTPYDQPSVGKSRIPPHTNQQRSIKELQALFGKGRGKNKRAGYSAKSARTKH